MRYVWRVVEVIPDHGFMPGDLLAADHGQVPMLIRDLDWFAGEPFLLFPALARAGLIVPANPWTRRHLRASDASGAPSSPSAHARRLLLVPGRLGGP